MARLLLCVALAFAVAVHATGTYQKTAPTDPLKFWNDASYEARGGPGLSGMGIFKRNFHNFAHKIYRHKDKYELPKAVLISSTASIMYGCNHMEQDKQSEAHDIDMWSPFTSSSKTSMSGKHMACETKTAKCDVPTDNNVNWDGQLDMDVYRGEVDGHSNFEWMKKWFWDNLDALSHIVDQPNKGQLVIQGNTLEDHYKPDIRTMDCLPLMMTKFIWSMEVKRMDAKTGFASGTIGGRKHTGDNYDVGCLSSKTGRASWAPAKPPCEGANALYDRFTKEWMKGVLPHNNRCAKSDANDKTCSLSVDGSKFEGMPTKKEIGTWTCTDGCFWDCKKPITSETGDDGKWRLGWFEVKANWFDLFDDTKYAACKGTSQFRSTRQFRSVRQKVLEILDH